MVGTSDARTRARLTVCHAHKLITMDGGTGEGTRVIHRLPEVLGRRGLERVEVYARA